MPKHLLPKSYFELLAGLLTVGCLIYPIASAIGLLIVSAYVLTDKYFSSNISDKERTDLAALKAEVAKLKLKAEAADLSKAFGR